jgi:hypothetical protein
MQDKLTRSVDNEVNNETALKEVQHLLKNGTVDLTPDTINRLRSKYSDDNVVDAIMEVFTERRQKIVKVSSIFMDAFQRKYKNEFHSMSLSKFMKRALKYKSKYNLSNEEFDEAKRIFEMRIYGTQNNVGAANVIYPNTNLSRVLGYPVTESTDVIKPSNTDDYGYLQEIIKIYQLCRSLHSYIVIQTMTYRDLQEESLNGVFAANNNINVYVHPVLAALFLPKIEKLEERMLYANIAGIINTRYNGHRIVTKPDFELFYSMVIDPADTVCDNISPMRDLKSRAEVQVQLWNNVYQLRNGKYYDGTSIEFMTYIDKCKISSMDNPDLLYLSDEGVILRRLFSIFAFRPILVRTMPIMGVITANPYNIQMNTVSITAIPYITYRLPQIALEGNVHELKSAITQVQYYMENGIFVPKVAKLLECNGPIIFYVPRRFTALPLNIATPNITYFGIQNYKNSTRDYQNISNIPVLYDNSIDFESYASNTSKNYYLRSIVAYENYKETSIILGHMTILYKYNKDNDGKIMSNIPTEYLLYIPRQANQIVSSNSVRGVNFPIQRIEDEMAAKDIGSVRGTIFVYARNSD